MEATAVSEQPFEAARAGSPADALRSQASGLIPLVVGITGHMDLAPTDVESLEKAVREAFAEFRHDNPDRPLALMTALAKGADTLVARVALDVGAQLVVVLPMPLEEYERDFADDERRQFMALLGDPRVVRRVHIPVIDRKSSRLDADTWRTLQYALAGAYIARQSDELLALWDGQQSDKIGGTAWVVDYRRDGDSHLDADAAACLARVPEPFGLREDLLEPSEGSAVTQIVTPRFQKPVPEKPCSRRNLRPQRYAFLKDNSRELRKYNRAVREANKRICELNEAARRLEESDPASVDEIASQLSSDEGTPPGLAPLRRSFALADALANRYQRRLNRALVWLFSLIFVAGVALTLITHKYAEELPVSEWLIRAYAGLLAVSYIIFIVVKWRRWQDRYQDYRAVAEGLRAQYYWRLAGLEHAASEYYVRRQRGELAWIQRIVRSCSVVAPPAGDDRLDDVHVLWAAGQSTYYAGARGRAQRKLNWRHVGSGALSGSLAIGIMLVVAASNARGLRIALIVTALAPLGFGFIELIKLVREGRDGVPAALAQLGAFAASIVLMLLLINVPAWSRSHPDTVLPNWMPHTAHLWLVLSFGMTALAGALFHGYAQVRAFAEHARRYTRLAAIFSQAAKRMRAALDVGKRDVAREMLVELGRESLTDHGEWIVLHRERPVELPEAAG